jgi:hypothetical protein
MKDHPGDFLTKCGCDIYLNPWWGARTARSSELIGRMGAVLGEPDLWFQGAFHELLWGPRDLPRSWRPGFLVNLSGTDGRLWRNFWLPWRLKSLQEDCKLPYAANVLDTETCELDVEYVEKYALAIPKIRHWLETGVIGSTLDLLAMPTRSWPARHPSLMWPSYSTVIQPGGPACNF